ncbi:MAG TPA: oligosaccharide flippase family protein, partial [Ktedonobacterales bacterium]|nr:oligosaccharide flippase family protein [Ktedonobacterales bacterium]
MNTLRRTASNIVMLLSGQIVTWVSTLILAAAYGRFLGSNGFGELYLATTFTSLIGFPIEFSFNQQIVRDVVREPQHARRYITMSLALKGALWIGLFALALILSVLLGYNPVVRWLIVICGLMLVSTAVSSTLISVQTAFMQVGMAKVGAVIEKVL